MERARRALPAGQSERRLGNVSGPREKPGATREVTQDRMRQNDQSCTQAHCVAGSLGSTKGAVSLFYRWDN